MWWFTLNFPDYIDTQHTHGTHKASENMIVKCVFVCLAKNEKTFNISTDK